MNKIKYIIHTDTIWCGMDNDYYIECDSSEIENHAQYIAYENFLECGGKEDLLDELNADRNEELDDWSDEYSDAEQEAFSYTIEEFNGTIEEWNKLINNEI